MAEVEQGIHAYSDAQLEKMHGNDGKSYDELLK